MNKQDYVAGLFFCNVSDKLALIRKNRPEWQKGRLNAIGGKIEPGETPEEAMVREFWEETGAAETTWQRFCKLNYRGGSVYFFTTCGYIDELESTTDEKIEIVDLNNLNYNEMISNLKWLIPMALDKDRVTAEVEDKS